MTVSAKLEKLLSETGIDYEVIDHPLAFTAQEEAAASHISGRHWAKTVSVQLDGSPALAVVPATRRLDEDKLRRLAVAERVHIAHESEFRDLFPDCELGAMPPFGRLYGQPTFVDEALREEERIAFHAGDHRTSIEMSYREYEQIAEPVVGEISGPPREPL